MDVVVSIPLIAGFALVLSVALVALRRTWLWWVPALALSADGIALYLAWPWSNTMRYFPERTGLEGLSNVLHVAVSFFIVGGGVAYVIIGARSRRRRELTQSAIAR